MNPTAERTGVPSTARQLHVAQQWMRADEAGTLSASSAGELPESALLWLSDSKLLQWDHPRVRVQAMRLTQRYRSPTQKALACYGFVQSLPFAFEVDGSRVTAPEVVHHGCGDDWTKATLFTALLRSLEIPARVRVVSIEAGALKGLLNAGDHVNHPVTEVFLEGGWQRVDSYVADPRLATAARSRLAHEGRDSGYGAQSRAMQVWRGDGDSVGCFAGSGSQELIRDWGVFHDVGEFVRCHPYASPGVGRLSIAIANRRVRALRVAGN